MITRIRRKLNKRERREYFREPAVNKTSDVPFKVACCVVFWAATLSVVFIPGIRFAVQTLILWPLAMTILFGGIITWIISADKRNRRDRIAHRLELLECDFEVIDATLTGALTFEGRDDLGPFWVGSDGGSLLIAQGQFLNDFTGEVAVNDKLYYREKMKIIWNQDKCDGIYIRNSGKKIPVTVEQDEERNIEFEDLIINSGLPLIAIIPGSLETWQEQIRAYSQTTTI